MKKLILPPLKIAGAGIAMGLVGDAFASEGLQQGSQVAGSFVAPAVNIVMGGHLIKQLKNINPKKKNG